jgi:hypothetical protein
MDTKRWIVSEPVERLPALFLALVATAIVFAAINAGFAPTAADLAGRQPQEIHLGGLVTRA